MAPFPSRRQPKPNLIAIPQPQISVSHHVRGGGTEGGGRVARAADPFMGNTWSGLIGNTAISVTFNAGNIFSLTGTTPTGDRVKIEGSYAVRASSPAGAAGPSPTVVTLASQGNVVLSGSASFPSSDLMLFTLNSEDLPGTGSPGPGVLAVLASGA